MPLHCPNFRQAKNEGMRDGKREGLPERQVTCKGSRHLKEYTPLDGIKKAPLGSGIPRGLIGRGPQISSSRPKGLASKGYN